MIYRKTGDGIIADGRRYAVGMHVLANEESVYRGLYGTILEIRTGEARGADSEKPDIRCRFDVPVLPEEVRAMEARFSVLRGAEVTLEDVELDQVLLSPDMLAPLDDLLHDRRTVPVWAVAEDWAVDGEAGHNEILCADREDAARVFHSQLSVEAVEGCIERWNGGAGFQFEHEPLFYACWLDGEYLSNHYEIRVEEKALTLPHNAEAFCRGVDAGQYERLLTVLTDNGVEADESCAVAEAIGFVLDLDMPAADTPSTKPTEE